MTRIQFRRDTAANWTTANPVLAQGEPGYETDTGKKKIGNGTTAWASLAYDVASAGSASTVGPDATVNGLLGVSTSPSNARTNIALITGRVEYTKVAVPGGSALNNIAYVIGSAGTAVSGVLGIYSAAGNLLGQTADVGANMATAAGYVSPLTATANIPNGDSYAFVATLVSAATTVPSLVANDAGLSIPGVNIGLTAAQGYRAFYTVVSGATVLPATMILANAVPTNRVYLLGVK